jgi:anti-sigma factor RsiW
MICDDARPLLHARLDGEIDAVQSATLDSHLAECGDCGREFERLEGLRTTIRSGLRRHRAPDGLRDQVRFAIRGAEYLDRGAAARDWRMWGAMAAAFLLCVVAAALYFANQRQQRILVAEEFFSAHQRALMGRAVDVVSTDQHTVKPWFNGKLPFSPPVIDLAAEGFPLEGGRVDYVRGESVAALVYRRRLHRIDLFVQPTSEQRAASQLEHNGFRELSWSKDGFAFTAVSDLNAGELSAFAELLKKR